MQTLRSIFVFLITLSLLASTPAVFFAQGEVFLEDKPDEVVLEIVEGSGEENTSLFPDETEPNQPQEDENAADEGCNSENEEQEGEKDGFTEMYPTSLEGVPVETPELTAAEFRELLVQNEGGVITLTGNVVWDDYWQDITIEHPTTVLMGDYGIHIPPNAVFTTAGPLRFEGNGVERPLFHIGFNCFISMEGAEITALGDGATAVYAEGTLDVTLLKVSAEGNGSVGIHGDTVHLSLCVVTAGGSAVISEAGDIRLDGCRVSPMPEGANATTREAVPGRRIQENGISIAVGDTFEEALNNNRWADYYLLDTERRIAANGYMFPALWENLPQDTSVAGEYTILCVPMNVPDWLPVEGVTAFEVPLHIVNENQPHIESAARFVGDTVMLRFFNEIEDENFILWYSDDNGETWLDFGQLPGAQVLPNWALADSLPPNCVYLFKLEVTGGSMAGTSNVLEFPFFDSDPDSEGGGDRTGVDRFPLGGTNDQSSNNLGGSNQSGNNPNEGAEDDNNPEVGNPGAGTGDNPKPETGGNSGDNPNISNPNPETGANPDDVAGADNPATETGENSSDNPNSNNPKSETEDNSDSEPNESDPTTEARENPGDNPNSNNTKSETVDNLDSEPNESNPATETGENPDGNPNVDNSKLETGDNSDIEPNEGNPGITQIGNDESGNLDDSSNDDTYENVDESERIPIINKQTPKSESVADKITPNIDIVAAMQDEPRDIDANTNDISVYEDSTQSLESIKETIESTDNKYPTATRVQPPVPQPSFPTGVVAGVLGGVVILTVGAASFIRIRKQGKVKNEGATKKNI